MNPQNFENSRIELIRTILNKITIIHTRKRKHIVAKYYRPEEQEHKNTVL